MFDTLKRLLGRHAQDAQTCPDCGTHDQTTYCSVCGYDLVNRVRATKHPPPST